MLTYRSLFAPAPVRSARDVRFKYDSVTISVSLSGYTNSLHQRRSTGAREMRPIEPETSPNGMRAKRERGGSEREEEGGKGGREEDGERRKSSVQWRSYYKASASGDTDLATACNTRGETPTKTPSMTRQVRQAH